MKQINVRMEDKLKKAFQKWCIEREVSMNEVIVGLIKGILLEDITSDYVAF